MPSASAQTDAAMLALFGPEDGAIAADWHMRAISQLEAAGYVEKSGRWQPKPGVSKWQEMTADEKTCMAYLIEEWDYGGLTTEYING